MEDDIHVFCSDIGSVNHGEILHMVSSEVSDKNASKIRISMSATCFFKLLTHIRLSAPLMFVAFYYTNHPNFQISFPTPSWLREEEVNVNTVLVLWLYEQGEDNWYKLSDTMSRMSQLFFLFFFFFYICCISPRFKIIMELGTSWMTI